MEPSIDGDAVMLTTTMQKKPDQGLIQSRALLESHQRSGLSATHANPRIVAEPSDGTSDRKILDLLMAELVHQQEASETKDDEILKLRLEVRTLASKLADAETSMRKEDLSGNVKADEEIAELHKLVDFWKDKAEKLSSEVLDLQMTAEALQQQVEENGERLLDQEAQIRTLNEIMGDPGTTGNGSASRSGSPTASGGKEKWVVAKRRNPPRRRGN